MMKLGSSARLPSFFSVIPWISVFLFGKGLSFKHAVKPNRMSATNIGRMNNIPTHRQRVVVGSSNGSDGLSDERKANLFQFMLRDLQVEGVPLLQCDANQPHTLQAALWTTMAELSEQQNGQKVCLIIEDVALDSLRTFVDDFLLLKTDRRLMDIAVELDRFSISLLGKGGVGPAVIIETAPRKSTETVQEEVSVEGIIADTQTFVAETIAALELCPYTKNPLRGPEGLQGVASGSMEYRVSQCSEICHVLSFFWTCICELLSVPEEQLSTSVLVLPQVGCTSSSPETDHQRFATVAEIISRSLCLYRGNDIFELLHFHPVYDRDLIHPVEKPAFGHLPPMGWLRPMLQMNGNTEEANSLSDEQLYLSNYQRRSPHTTIVIKRVSQLDAAVKTGSSPNSGIVDLDLGNGIIEKASGISCYARNAITLAAKGKQALQQQ